MATKIAPIDPTACTHAGASNRLNTEATVEIIFTRSLSPEATSNTCAITMTTNAHSANIVPMDAILFIKNSSEKLKHQTST